jgi:amino acid transporter
VTTQQDTLAPFGYEQELRRGIGLGGLVSYGLIFMVPIAPFAIFGAVESASNGMPALAYVVALVAMFFTASSYAQMVRAYPLAGSVYNYTGRALGPSTGFVVGWAMLLDYILVPALLYLVAGIAVNATVPQVPVWVWLVGFVALNTVINLAGIRMTASFTNIMIVCEMAILVLFLAIGIWALAHGKGHGFSLEPLFHSHGFSWALIFGAVSVAALSFLGFDGISMLAEEAKGGARSVGTAIKVALVLAGVLFIVQVWVAALLVPDPAGVIASGDPSGTAFYDAAQAAGGHWLSQVTSMATAISWGLADTLVAQVAVSRLLYSMARDGQMPKLLSRVSRRTAVPSNAILLVAAISTGLGLWAAHRGNGVSLLASLINMGAMCAFLMLHLSVIVHYMIRNHSRDLWRHLLMPIIGFGILVAVIIHANIAAQWTGGVWIGIGILVMIGLHLARRSPELASTRSAPATVPSEYASDRR